MDTYILIYSWIAFTFTVLVSCVVAMYVTQYMIGKTKVDKAWKVILFALYFSLIFIISAIVNITPFMLVYDTSIDWLIIVVSIIHVVFYASLGKDIFTKYLQKPILKFIKDDVKAFTYFVIGFLSSTIIAIVLYFLQSN